MLLLVTFLSTGSLEEVPRVDVVKIQAPTFYVSNSLLDPTTVDGERTRKNCEAMGRLYVDSLAGKLDSSTEVVITCLGEVLIPKT